jgi:hypothetical protein
METANYLQLGYSNKGRYGCQGAISRAILLCLEFSAHSTNYRHPYAHLEFQKADGTKTITMSFRRPSDFHCPKYLDMTEGILSCRYPWDIKSLRSPTQSEIAGTKPLPTVPGLGLSNFFTALMDAIVGAIDALLRIARPARAGGFYSAREPKPKLARSN